MNKVFKFLSIFLVGGFLYSVIELLFRGRTHCSMAFAGGVSLFLFALFRPICGKSIFKKCLLSSAIITSVEFIIGIFLNIVRGMRVWDYSNQPFNLFGQVCLLFSVLWFLLAIPMDLVIRAIDTFFDRPLPIINRQALF